jgi:hypothetical protein
MAQEDRFAVNLDDDVTAALLPPESRRPYTAPTRPERKRTVDTPADSLVLTWEISHASISSRLISPKTARSNPVASSYNPASSRSITQVSALRVTINIMRNPVLENERSEQLATGIFSTGIDWKCLRRAHI